MNSKIKFRGFRPNDYIWGLIILFFNCLSFVLSRTFNIAVDLQSTFYILSLGMVFAMILLAICDTELGFIEKELKSYD